MKKTIRTSIASVLAAAALTGFAAAGPGVLRSMMKAPEFPEAVTTVRGVMVYSDSWTAGSEQPGIYTVEVRPGGAVKAEHTSALMGPTVAAITRGGVMYAVEADMTGYWYSQYNASTYARSSREEIDVQNVPSDLTYDAVTDKVYGGFYDEDYGGFSRFASFGLTDAEAKDIPSEQRDERDFIAIAATPEGTIYALHGAYNYLKRFDPRTGNETKIGVTGLDCEVDMANRIFSSMVWDEANQRLIAVVAHNAGTRTAPRHVSALYTIDPKDVRTEGNRSFVTPVKVMDMPGNASIAGLEIVEQAVPASAPAAPRNLRVEFDSPTALTGKVKFTAPAVSAGGTALSGELLAQVSVGGTVVATLGGIAPGAEAETASVAFPAGSSTVKVTMATADTRGASAEAEVFAGEDEPAPVSDVLLEITPEGWAKLTWKAPAAGLNGGNIDPAGLQYTVRRVHDGAVVALNISETTFTDKTPDTSRRAISYSVSVRNGAGSAPAVESNKCLSSGALAVPFTEPFNSKDDFELWTLVNVNPASTWALNEKDKYAFYKYADDKTAADNWLISPAIRLEAGKAYKISYSWRANNKNYPESFAVHCGTGAAPSAMGTALAEHNEVLNTQFATASVVVRPGKTGVRFVGIHATSQPWRYMLYVDDIKVEEIDNRVPAQIADLTVTPAAGGALKATVSFTAPDKGNDGQPLDALTEARLYRRGTAEPVKVFTDITPGQKLSFEDEGITASGLTGYTATASNAVGEGVAASAEAYVGIDAPGAPTDVHISELDRHPHLEWTAPATGANGGWFDASALTYRIVRSDGTVVAESATGTSFTDNSVSYPAKGQDAYWYLITPYTGKLKGAYAQSETLLFGTPYPAPATETFANAGMGLYPWIAQSSTAVNYSWTLDNMGYNPQAADQNGDQGLATFHSVGEPVGSSAWFYSPKISIAGLENPTLSFWMYHTATPGDETMEIFVAAASDRFSETGTVLRREAEETGWVRHSVSLASYAGAEWVRIGFKGTGAAVEDVYIDNVAVASRARFNVAVSALTLPARVAAGVPVKATVILTNTGTDELTDVKVTLSTGATVYAGTTVASLAPDTEKAVELTIPSLEKGTLAIKATATAEGDGDAADNSAEATVKVVDPVLQTVTGLEATVGTGSVSLVWNEPAERGAVTDDFEGYKDFAIDGVGEWTMWDGDYDVTYAINTSYGQYPNASDRKAFQVINAKVLGIDIWAQGTPHSGNKMMAALACQLYVNNDWLISPELNGSEQWISFYAKSFTTDQTAPERMRVFYSTSDNSPANFTELTSGYVELSESWVEYRYHLPEGARYFAINCVSDGSFAMFVDDATFNDLTVPAWTLTGYDVYRDGVKIGHSATTAFTDDTPLDKAVYTVVPVFAQGEGGRSASCTVELTGIGSVLEGDDAPVNVYNLQGMLLRRAVRRSEATRGLAPGTYLLNNEKVRVE